MSADALTHQSVVEAAAQAEEDMRVARGLYADGKGADAFALAYQAASDMLTTLRLMVADECAEHRWLAPGAAEHLRALVASQRSMLIAAKEAERGPRLDDQEREALAALVQSVYSPAELQSAGGAELVDVLRRAETVAVLHREMLAGIKALAAAAKA